MCIIETFPRTLLCVVKSSVYVKGSWGDSQDVVREDASAGDAEMIFRDDVTQGCGSKNLSRHLSLARFVFCLLVSFYYLLNSLDLFSFFTIGEIIHLKKVNRKKIHDPVT